MSRKLSPAVALLALVAACDNNGSLPPVAFKEYAVEPSVTSLTLVQDDTLHISAAVRDVASNTTLPSSVARVTFAAGDPTIVSASSGAVQGLKAGVTKITATFRDEYGYTHTADVPVTVSAMPLGAVVFTTPDTTIFLDETLAAKAVAKDTSGTSRPLRAISYTLRDSADAAYAMVTSDGIVTPLQVGTVAVLAISENRTDTLTIGIAQRAVATVTVAPATSTISVGGTQQLTATLKASNGLTLTGRTVTWSSSDDAVATVDSTGKVTAVSAASGGTTVTITATSEGKSGTAEVVVNP